MTSQRDRSHSLGFSKRAAGGLLTAISLALIATTVVEAADDRASPPGKVMHDWPEARDAAVVIDGLQLTLTTTGGGAESPAIPHLRVRAPNGATAELVGEGGLSAVHAAFGVGRLDERRPTQDVILATYTGGAHCCVEIKALSLAEGRWTELDFGMSDGAPMDFPRDVDGDGVSEVELRDDRFLYTFTSYAGSYAPPRFFAVRDGAVTEVSAEPRFRSRFQAYLPDARTGCVEHGNGACAAYVAAAARTGQFPAAWRLMTANHDPESGWPIVPAACLTTPKAGTKCPKDQEYAFKSFPDALKWFLIDTGYLTADAMHWRRGQGPSFDCARARGMNVTLVCTTPELAAADRALAAAYTAAAARRGTADLRSRQREWLTARDKAAPDAGVLQRMYDRRIAELNALPR